MPMNPGAALARCGIALACVLASVLMAEDDPDSMWVDAYAWLQAGENLEKAGALPLSLGSLIEAQERFEELRDRHPEFEPELVGYRIEALGARISELQPRLAEGEIETMTRYLEFIRAYGEGMEMRFSGRFEDALDALNDATLLLDQIIIEKPDEYRDAIDTLYGLLHGSVGWIEEQLGARRRSVSTTFVADSRDLGTTRFVTASDLPADGDSVLPTAELFPALPDPADIADLRTLPGSGSSVDPEPEPEDAIDPEPGNGPTLPAFRMNSRQQSGNRPEVAE